MQGVIDQLQNQNHNNNQNQQHGVDLQGFMRLSPPTFHHPEQPLEADDWRRDVTSQLESAGVNAINYVTFATYLLRGPAAQWWDTHKSSLAEGTVVTWNDFKAAFRARYVPQAIMNHIRPSSATSFRAANLLSLIRGNSSTSLAMRVETSQMMQAGK